MISSPPVAFRRPRARPLVALVACLWLPGVAVAEPPYGPEPNPAPELQTIKTALEAANARMGKQEEELKALRARLDADKAQRDSDDARRAAEQAALPKTITDKIHDFLRDNPTIHALRDGLTLSGFLQADLAFRQSSEDEVNPSTGVPLNEDRFLIRRARLKLTADYGWVGGALELDGNTVSGPTARVVGAEVSVRWPPPTPAKMSYLALTLGLFKTPFGYEVVQGDKERLFMERSTVIRALFPGEYDLGARLAGGWKFLRYSVAAMNGEPIGEKSFPGRDPNQSKDFVGRLGVDVKIGERVTITGGFSAVYGTGFHRGSPSTKDVLVWRDTNENGIVDPGELQVITGSAPTPSQNFNRYALAGDLQLKTMIPRIGELTVYGEYLAAQNLDRGIQPADPIGSGHDLRESGFYVAFTQELTKWAMVGVRYDQYNPDADSTNRTNGIVVPADMSYWSLDVAAAARYANYGRLIVEWDHNHNHLGRDASGNPANLKDDALIVRGEVVF